MRWGQTASVLVIAAAVALWSIGLSRDGDGRGDRGVGATRTAAVPAGGVDSSQLPEIASLPLPSINPRTGVRWFRDVEYRDTPDEAQPRKHQLDLYLPSSERWMEGRPLVVWIHGGGWFMGDKDDAFGLYGRYCRRLAECGVAAANISYRLSPRARHPDHIEDIAAASAWLIEHAEELGFDAGAVFTSGHSAGGHLAALLAVDDRYLQAAGVEPDAIRGVIGSSGVYDLRTLLAEGWNFAGAFSRDNAADASPVVHADASDPPFVLIVEEYGDFMRAQTQHMIDALDAAGVDHEVVDMAACNHITMLGDLLEPDGVTLTTTLDFIRKVLNDAVDPEER